MTRYYDNCDKHDLPYGNCIECEKEENTQLHKEIISLKFLIREATARLAMPIKDIRGDGFRELMYKLRSI